MKDFTEMIKQDGLRKIAAVRPVRDNAQDGVIFKKANINTTLDDYCFEEAVRVIHEGKSFQSVIQEITSSPNFKNIGIEIVSNILTDHIVSHVAMQVVKEETSKEEALSKITSLIPGSSSGNIEYILEQKISEFSTTPYDEEHNSLFTESKRIKELKKQARPVDLQNPPTTQNTFNTSKFTKPNIDLSKYKHFKDVINYFEQRIQSGEESRESLIKEILPEYEQFLLAVGKENDDVKNAARPIGIKFEELLFDLRQASRKNKMKKVSSKWMKLSSDGLPDTTNFKSESEDSILYRTSRFPLWAAYYISYGEGATDREKIDIDNWKSKFPKDAVYVFPDNSERDFCHTPEFGKSADCVTCIVKKPDTVLDGGTTGVDVDDVSFIKYDDVSPGKEKSTKKIKIKKTNPFLKEDKEVGETEAGQPKVHSSNKFNLKKISDINYTKKGEEPIIDKIKTVNVGPTYKELPGENVEIKNTDLETFFESRPIDVTDEFKNTYDYTVLSIKTYGKASLGESDDNFYLLYKGDPKDDILLIQSADKAIIQDFIDQHGEIVINKEFFAKNKFNLKKISQTENNTSEEYLENSHVDREEYSIGTWYLTLDEKQQPTKYKFKSAEKDFEFTVTDPSALALIDEIIDNGPHGPSLQPGKTYGLKDVWFFDDPNNLRIEFFGRGDDHVIPIAIVQ